jgi:phosphate transport system permease protein
VSAVALPFRPPSLSGVDRRRRVLSALAVAFCAASVAIALVPLALILVFVLRQGVPALNVAFFTETPRPVGETGGGMANAMVGTLMLLGMASALAVPVGIACALYVAEFRNSRLSSAVRFAADILNGVPSIVIGIFAYTVAVMPFKRFSALAGGLALAIMMLPIVLRTTDELLALVPGSLREGALALGATRARAALTVMLPAALPGVITGVLVAIARIAGETAPLLFTSFNNRFWSTRPDQPIASLTVQIYTYAISPYEDWHRQAWAGALVLIVAVLAFSILARLATRRLERMHRP